MGFTIYAKAGSLITREIIDICLIIFQLHHNYYFMLSANLEWH